MAPSIYLQQKDFAAAEDNLFHGFFTRHGGVSKGVYAALNCGLGSEDAPEFVQQNRGIVAKEAGVPEILSVYQEHGTACVIVSKSWAVENRPKADAMVTDKPGLGLGILTADCAPVLLCGFKENGAPVIGAAHAGWRGALEGVLENTIKEMQELGAQAITACVGPCISKASYEVSATFLDPFMAEHEESARFFHAGNRSGHAYFDLSGYCAWRLFRAGLRAISLMDQDTYTLEDDFYSYRRATHKGIKEYGRQISVIAIRES